jgi:tetratricopeptide (TPR) repeat protein
MGDSAALDAQELLHLGLYASQHGEPHQAIECLKRCIALEPESPKATYLLGALYAQIGLYDRAKSTLSRAVELNPDEHTASFQLGLLYLTSNEIPEARAAWAKLDALPADHFLVSFRSGLLALIADEFAKSLVFLDQGIKTNQLNEALNEDMRKLSASVQAAAAPPGTAVVDGDPLAVTKSGHHFLGGYRQQNRQ